MTYQQRQARILLVDDNADDVELARLAFRAARISNPLEVAEWGQQALDRLFGRTRTPNGQPYPLPDLILLDLKMPGMGGVEVLRQIKEAPVLRMIPVVILTSSSQEGDRAMSYATGANSYLVKPISLDGMVRIAHAVADYWLSINVGPPLPDVLDGPPT